MVVPRNKAKKVVRTVKKIDRIIEVDSSEPSIVGMPVATFDERGETPDHFYRDTFDARASATTRDYLLEANRNPKDDETYGFQPHSQTGRRASSPKFIVHMDHAPRRPS